MSDFDVEPGAAEPAADDWYGPEWNDEPATGEGERERTVYDGAAFQEYIDSLVDARTAPALEWVAEQQAAEAAAAGEAEAHELTAAYAAEHGIELDGAEVMAAGDEIGREVAVSFLTAAGHSPEQASALIRQHGAFPLLEQLTGQSQREIALSVLAEARSWAHGRQRTPGDDPRAPIAQRFLQRQAQESGRPSSLERMANTQMPAGQRLLGTQFVGGRLTYLDQADKPKGTGPNAVTTSFFNRLGRR